jgi:hypothetical protein
MWLGEQTAAASALSAIEAMAFEAEKQGNPNLFEKNPMRKMFKKCMKLEYEIEDEEETFLFQRGLEYVKT